MGLRESVWVKMSDKYRITYCNINEFPLNLLSKKLINFHSVLIDLLYKIRSELKVSFRHPFWTVKLLTNSLFCIAFSVNSRGEINHKLIKD